MPHRSTFETSAAASPTIELRRCLVLVVRFLDKKALCVAPLRQHAAVSGVVMALAATLSWYGLGHVISRAAGEDNDFGYGPEGLRGQWVQAISVQAPALRSRISGSVIVRFTAPGMRFAEAYCWQQPTKAQPSAWGHDTKLTASTVELASDGRGSFTFPADEFPNGPITIRIFAHASGLRDVFELQLFNEGGVRWNEGAPKSKPTAARDLQLVYLDDFDAPLSISGDGKNAKYAAHKPRSGDFSGWPFTTPRADGEPFHQEDTFLRIRAAKDTESPKGRTGLIASVNMDGQGLWASAPAYFEARLLAHSAPGTWPAFWTISHLDRGQPSDELDVIEAYGGIGNGHPSHPGYHAVSHFWGQKDAHDQDKAGFSALPMLTKLGGGASWSTTFHTYGVLLGVSETVYYVDGIEILRHSTNDLSKKAPHCFLLDYAIGGISGWPIDLARYGDASDMYVDYVRVYAKRRIVYALPPSAP
jgi:hypothetical protein